MPLSHRLSPDLSGKCLIYPRRKQEAYVKILHKFQEPIGNFTLCMKVLPVHYPCTLLSYATKDEDNEIRLLTKKLGLYELTVGGESITFTIPEKERNASTWQHVCCSWARESGVVAFWLNGKILARRIVKSDYWIPKEGVMILGQDQDSLGGSFDPDQQFEGEMADVCMWPRYLKAEEKRAIFREGKKIPGAYFDWDKFPCEYEGNIVVEDKVKPDY